MKKIKIKLTKGQKARGLRRLEYLAIGKHPGDLNDKEIKEMNDLKDLYGNI